MSQQSTNKPRQQLDQPGVLIILPVLNEGENIIELLNRLEQELADRPHTICIIDDGSRDDTVEKVQTAIVDGYPAHLIQRQKKHRGSQRGSALMAGMEWGLQHTSHEIFVEIDGDLSHQPEELKDGLRLIVEKGYQVAIASKYMPGSRVINRPLGRRIVSVICGIAVNIVITHRIKDWSNGYRFYDRAAAYLLTQHRLRYGSPVYLIEVLALWLKRGLRVVEFPSLYIGRHEGLSKLRLTDLAKASVAVFEIGFRYHFSDFAQRVEQPGDHPKPAYTLSSISNRVDSQKSLKRPANL
jgi:dolichol-phosphate mannosyltransferase